MLLVCLVIYAEASRAERARNGKSKQTGLCWSLVRIAGVSRVQADFADGLEGPSGNPTAPLEMVGDCFYWLSDVGLTPMLCCAALCPYSSLRIPDTALGNWQLLHFKSHA